MKLAPIPGPPSRPLFGNLSDIDSNNPMQSMCSLTETYGPIWSFRLGGEERVVVGSQALMDEVCDEDRFSKVVTAGLEQTRNGVHDGLGTAYGPHERNWGIAHRILLPHFGPLAIRGMFGEMHDIASQLVMKWARHGPDYRIQAAEEFTRLTLDTIALCAMGYRFNSYYSQTLHPFVEAMKSFLRVSGYRARRGCLTQLLCVSENQEYWENIELLRETSMAIIQARKEHPSDKKDFLHGMLHGVDPETGEKMTDDNIVNNMITFLVAGHETTSGLLCFTFYYLLNSATALAKARQEVDEAVGRSPVTIDHLGRLPYLSAVLRESLRLSPTVPSVALAAKQDTVLGGQYHVKAGTPVIALFPMIHRDPSVYGSDASEFRPERMLDEAFERRNRQFPNCWKPFGNGVRACIGRSFAWQQALLILAMLLQNFDFTADDASYRLRIKQTLTVKPEGFCMRAQLRGPVSVATLAQALDSATIHDPPPVQASTQMTAKLDTARAVDVYYGSNTGTCEGLARQLAGHASAHGFQAGTVGPLNSAKGLSTGHPIVIVAASYNGQPADNAAQFVSWTRTLQGTELAHVEYAVFGCGHSDWAKTLHAVPKYLDSVLEERGAVRLAALGTVDVAQGGVLADFEAWEEDVFWPAMQQKYGGPCRGDVCEPAEGQQLHVEVSTPQSPALQHHLYKARIEEVRVLSSSGASAKMHVEIKLPSHMEYAAGDCLAVLPRNPKETVRRALKYFGMTWDSVLTISSATTATTTIATATAATLPTDVLISAVEVFGAHIELTQPATERDLVTLRDAAHDEAARNKLARLAGEAFGEEIAAKRVSVLDLVERFPSACISPGVFLSMQPAMRIRQYCISSSPLWNPRHVTLTYCVEQPVVGGQRRSQVGSGYLSSLAPGDEVSVSVKKRHEVFPLADGLDCVPLIMVAVGVGLAPFRSYVQERAAQVAAGRSLVPALLFYGCRSPDDDLIYSELFERWQQLGAVSLRHAFSRAPERSRGCRHVQDRIYSDRDDILELVEAGARILVCVPEQMREGVQMALAEVAKGKMTEGEGEAAEALPVTAKVECVTYEWNS